MKLIYLVPVLLLLGCGARKKDLKQVTSGFKFNAQLDTSATTKSRLDITNNTVESLRHQFLNTSFQYQGKPGDSATVQQYDSNGKLIGETKFKGSGNINVNSQAGTTQKDEQHTEVLKAVTKVEASGSKKIEAAGAKKETEVHVKRDAVAWPWWLWLIPVAVLLYLNFRYKWISRLKNHVLNKKTDSNTFAKNNQS